MEAGGHHAKSFLSTALHNPWIKAGDQVGQAWFTLGKFMLGLSSHLSCPGMPRNSFQENLLFWFSQCEAHQPVSPWIVLVLLEGKVQHLAFRCLSKSLGLFKDKKWHCSDIIQPSEDLACSPDLHGLEFLKRRSLTQPFSGVDRFSSPWGTKGWQTLLVKIQAKKALSTSSLFPPVDTKSTAAFSRGPFYILSLLLW